MSRPTPITCLRRARRDDGVVIPMTALVLIPLMIIAAFSIDVGGWYAQTSRMQRSADAAALAGVVWMPDINKARQVALETAAKNGFAHDDGSLGTGVTVDVTSPGAQKLKVEITSPGDLFLGQLVMSSITFKRSATAEYVLPVPLGSPENRLGNDPTTGFTPNLWASISGPWTRKVDGDAYSTKCGQTQVGSTCQTTGTNIGDEYRTSGFIYAIEVPQSEVGQTLTVQVYDAGFYQRANYANVETADNGAGDTPGVNTQFELFRADDTPLDTSDNLVPANSLNGSCSFGGPGRQYIATGTNAGTFQNTWFTLCSVVANKPGQWLLQVKSSNIPGVSDSGGGWNQYSLRASLSGATQPSLYALNDLSLFNNLPGLSGTFSSTFFLAEIAQFHAGKTLEINLYDPGDGASGTYHVNILTAGGGTTACSYKARGAASSTNANPCRIATRSGGTNTYNGQWLDITVDVPSGYTCVDCWWKIQYDFAGVSSGASPNDRTIWSAKIIGDPVHLVE